MTNQSKAIKAALRERLRDGKCATGSVPYGYRVGARGRLVVDRREQRCIRLARDLQDGGFSLRKVAVMLVDAGYRPRGGKDWHPQQVKRMVMGFVKQAPVTARVRGEG